jgi:hypothetical protein
MILFRLEKKTGVPSSLFTTGHKLTFNCVLHCILVNQILVYENAVKLRSLSLPILETLRSFRFCFVWRKKQVFQLVYLQPDTHLRSIAFCVVY